MDDEGDVREEGCIRRVWRVPRGHSPILRKHRFSSDTPRVLTTPLPYTLIEGRAVNHNVGFLPAGVHPYCLPLVHKGMDKINGNKIKKEQK